MPLVNVLRGVIASGQRLVVGTQAEISDSDFRILMASGKVSLAHAASVQTEETFVLAPAEDPPARERATKSRRSKAVLP